MPRPRFSELLAERRHQLGLTIEQAARVLKLKEQVLIAFEEGDFANIPKSGYAQGMLSSYARYLGLNAREVVDQFQEDLYEHTNGVMSHELRRRTRNSVYGRGILDGREEQRTRQSSTNSNLPEVSHLLPENPLLGQTDAYDTTSRPRSRTESYRQGSAMRARQRSYPQGRPYTGRTTYSTYERTRQRGRDGGATSSRRSYEPGDVVSRSVAPHEYVDDLRVDNSASSYHPASTREGRAGTRQRSSTQRPQVRRSPQDARRRQLRSRDMRRQPQHTGFLGFLEVFFSDSRRAIATVVAVLVIALIVIISTSIRSCATGTVKEKRTVTVDAASTAASTTAASTSAATTESTTATTAAQSTAAASSEATTYENVSVKVSVNSGAVTWVEVNNDGTSEVAETITGPWEKTFDVTDSITIRVGNTTAVSVTKNGENVQFDELSSGLGTVTIKGSGKPAETTGANGTSTSDGNSADGTSSSDSSNSTNTSSSNSNSESSSNSSNSNN